MSKELKNKLKITGLILLIIQILSNVPIMGINREVLQEFSNTYGQNFSFLTLFSGNAFARMSIFVVGISPYITSSIIMQLFRVIIPSLDELAKDGKTGMDRFKKISFYVSIILTILQSIPIAISFASYGLLVENNAFYISIVTVMLIMGSLIQIGCGQLIDKIGIGNGISLILLLNIISRLPSDIVIIYDKFMRNKPIATSILIGIICLCVVAITYIGIIYLQEGEIRIKTMFSSKIKGQKMTDTNSNNFIPLKVNMAGVMPIIFTTSIFQFYIMIISLLKVEQTSIFYKIGNVLNSSNWFSINQWYYSFGFILYCLLIFAFSYFYTSLVFDTKEVSENLMKSGGIIPGIRPGTPTKEFLDKKIINLRIVGSICLIIVTTFPMLIANICNISSISFGGTSIIIIVGVILETYKTIETEKLESKSSSFLF